jgi:hypothetical protein
LAEAELAEEFDERNRLPPWPHGEQVCDLADQAVASAPDLTVADDGAAEAFPNVQVGEVAQGVRAGNLALGSGGPVHVVVDNDRPVHVRCQDGHRVEVADEEWSVR